MKLDSLLSRPQRQRVRHDLVLDKQIEGASPDQCIGESHRIALDIAAPEICQPHDIVKLRKEQVTCARLEELLANLVQLALEGFTCERVGKNRHRVLRKIRPVDPDLRRKIGAALDPAVTRCGDSPVAGSRVRVHAAAVKAEYHAVVQCILQKFSDRRHALFSGPHEPDSGSLKLSLRGNEISAVCPEIGTRSVNDQNNIVARAAREIFDNLEPVADIFRGVAVRRCH